MKAPLLILLIFCSVLFSACTPEDAQQGVYTISSIEIYHIDCEYEIYDKDGILDYTYTGEARFRTDYFHYDQALIDFQQDGTTYLMEWDTVKNSQIERGYLEITLGGTRVKSLTSFTFHEYLLSSNGRETETTITGSGISQDPSMFPQGIYFSVAGTETCTKIDNIYQETRRGDMTLYSRIAGFTCKEESYIDAQLFY